MLAVLELPYNEQVLGLGQDVSLFSQVCLQVDTRLDNGITLSSIAMPQR